MSKRNSRGGKSRQRMLSERTTPAQDGYVTVDNTRTFLTHGAFLETMINPEPVYGIVRIDLDGEWSQRVTELPDEPVLMLRSGAAREIGQALLDGADAADRDAAKWRETHGDTTDAP